MPPLFLAAKQSTYRAQRVASQGAGITLTYGCGEFTATMDCVARITPILGTRGAANGEFPTYAIPFEDAQSAITKLSEKYSVALVDSVCDADSSRFVLIWKIERAAKAGQTDLFPLMKQALATLQKIGGIENISLVSQICEVITKAEGTAISQTTEPTKHTFDPDEF